MDRSNTEDNSSEQNLTELFYRLMYQGAFGTVVVCRAAEAGFARLACFYLPTELDALIAFVADPRNKDCYYKYNLFDGAGLQARGINTIGSKRELTGLVAFGLDVDVASKDSKYSDQQTALMLLDLMPLPPSAIIGSNGPDAGIHAYWFLHPLTIQTPEQYEYVRLLARRWYRELAKLAAPSKIDHTSGPERLLRPPGAIRASGELVTVLELPGHRYSLNQFLLPADQHDSIHIQKEENEQSVILDYLHNVADIHNPEPIMIQAGWSPRRDDPTLWDRPESTSGAPTAQVYCSGDGRPGATIKTPGLINTLATDPETGERVAAAVPDTPKWLNLQAFWVFMTQGALTPEAWRRASRYARNHLPRGVEFDCIPQVPTLKPPVQRAASPEQITLAKHELAQCRTGDNRLNRMARKCVEIGQSDEQAWELVSALDEYTSPIKEPHPQHGYVKLFNHELIVALRQTELKTTRGCRSLGGAVIRQRSDPQEVAIRVMAQYWGWVYDDPTRCRLRYWSQSWFTYNGKCWQPIDDDNIEVLLFKQAHEVVDAIADRMQSRYLEAIKRGDTVKPPKFPKFPSDSVSQVVKFIKSRNLLMDIEVPHLQWESELTTKVSNVANLVIFENGIGEIIESETSSTVCKVGDLMPHDPRLFSFALLPFAYDPSATCDIWQRSLEQWLSINGQRDIQSENLLGEWAGLCLVHDLSFNKLMNIIGPPRSGKGTICKVFEMLLGEVNVVHPRLDQLQKDFGLESILNKQAIIIEDSKLGGGSAERSRILSLMLGISAGDKTNVNRKFKGAQEQRLPGRITIVSNEAITFNDESGALMTRTLLVETRQSFYGRENRQLIDKLRAELPGIFNWALEGLQRLRTNGAFTLPASTKQHRDLIAGATSPLQRFFEDCCILVPEVTIEKDKLFQWYREWARANELRPEGSPRFAIALRTAVQKLGKLLGETRPHGGKNHWVGITLAPELMSYASPETYFRIPHPVVLKKPSAAETLERNNALRLR